MGGRPGPGMPPGAKGSPAKWQGSAGLLQARWSNLSRWHPGVFDPGGAGPRSGREGS
jgi:hypothetical protein